MSCSGGGGGGTTPPPLQGTITGQSRVVTNQIYTYTGTAASGTASNYSWAWGDGSTGSTNASSGTQNKIWRAPGNYTATLSFTDSTNTTASVSQAVTVIGTPVISTSEHACAIRSDNSVACWGGNNFGQLGDGTQIDRPTPVVVKGLVNITSLTGNYNQSCALLANGTVSCWGAIDAQGADLPSNVNLIPQPVSGLSDVISIVSGSFHHCALKTNGTVWCWGYQASSSVFGNGAVLDPLQLDLAPVQVVGINDATVLASGNDHVCIIKANKTVQCWGSNGYGQTGSPALTPNGLQPLHDTETPFSVPGVTNAINLALGAATSCVVLESGAMQCWGDNDRGQNASGTAVGLDLLGQAMVHFKPTVVTTPVSNISAAAQGYPACALKMDGTVTCWGDAQPLNSGSHAAALETPVVQLGNDNAFVSSGAYTCVLKFDGRLFCRGVNYVGQLGDGSGLDSPNVFVQVLMDSATFSVDPVGNIAAGAGFTCALKGDTSVACWTNAYDAGFHGELGNSASLDSFLTPVTVSSVGGGGTLTGVSSITAGGQHACALKKGAVVCWGDNVYGQLGNGSTTESNFPVTVTGLSDAVAISTGNLHTCALKVGGTVACWGNWETLYGNIQTTIPLTINGVSNVTAISNGAGFTCALKQDKSVMCWGSGNGGQLGDGNGNSNDTPVNVTGLNDITAIATSKFLGHSCAVKSNGAVVCWGKGGNGQLSSGGVWTDTYSPVAMGNLGTIRTVAAGYLHTCALRINGTVTCWGTGGLGQLGDGNGTSTPYPSTTFDVSGLTNVSTIAAGKLHNCAVKSDSTVWCWGDGYGNVPVLVAGLSVTMPALTFWK